eukprot:15464916-Alexandrium_andersonii.AAC.1
MTSELFAVPYADPHAEPYAGYYAEPYTDPLRRPLARATYADPFTRTPYSKQPLRHMSNLRFSIRTGIRQD